ncbi:3-hydroxy-3-methylglutaryl-coenzyme A reductase [Olea europaea subsp. europaea]|uniref:3-hydroxy-3-methylglutaryl coenzyme A reductase n=1 Tax=Olea europaea subsp. europaea TaxID=158383 RepID=A0A8S0RUG2_OLEEU|nr:3-hydroxy-3-methylglutaryl-coenzyme A reductase [Olea europaea subsp. europaea]
MDVRRRQAKMPQSVKIGADEPPMKPNNPKPSDALPLPLSFTNGLFFTMFFSVMYFLLTRWREKIRNSTPLHVVTLSELAASVSLLASIIYLIGFFGIDFVQSVIYRSNEDAWDVEEEENEKLIIEDDSRMGTSPATTLGCAVPVVPLIPQQPTKVPVTEKPAPIITPQSSEEDEQIVNSVVEGKVPSYSLESKLGDCKRAASIRREALQRITGKSLEGLPLEGFDYESILGQCCEMPVGYVQIPVGIAGPLLLNGAEFMVPMATTEGCLVASTNRGCKAIYASGGATGTLLKDGMTRAPVVRFETAKRAAELKLYLESPVNYETISVVFNKANEDAWDVEEEENEKFIIEEDSRMGASPATTLGCAVPVVPIVPAQPTKVPVTENPAPIITPQSSEEDEQIVNSVVEGKTPSYSLESKLGDCKRAASIRREALQRITGKSLEGLPLEGFDYESILGQCCEMPVGYVQIPVGIAGPLLLNGTKYMVPMATTEGCLVASTNRGCKAIYASGGAICTLLKDGMTRAPAVRFGTAKRAAELKFYLENPLNHETLSVIFNKSSRFARLQGIQCAMAGKNLYIRFTCSTGDAMGMNMVSKGVQNVLDYLENDFPDMDVIGISGNFCSDKKPAAVNWIEGRGKSVVCEAIIKEEIVTKVLKTNVAALVELNMLKNLTGSAIAGALGGFNAHASNIVSAVYIATGQDPAQNIESSHCITMMEAVNDGKDLHISVTMPSIEVGTVGGGTQLASQSACLNLLGVKGASKELAGANARLLATIVAGSVLAGELSLMSAIAAGQLVKSHMKYNRSSKDVTKISSQGKAHK